MLLTRLSSDQGNAVIEFIAFAVLLFVPLATFAAQSSVSWVAKQQATTVATQLSRAYALGPQTYELVAEKFRIEYPRLQLETSKTACCVIVLAKLGEAWASSKQVL